MPVKGILGLQDPVILVGEYNKFGRDTHQLGGIEGCHTLVIRDAEV